MKLLVTGASGFIGRNVLLRAPRDWEITAVYHQTELADFLRSRGIANVRPVRCDLARPEAVRSNLTSLGKWDACLYLAANGDPTRSESVPAWDLESNTLALLNLMDAVSIGHLVYVSSGAVYDGLRGPVSPASPVAPVLPYAISKLASERYIRFYAERRGSLEYYTVVRFFGAYGPYEPSRKITTRLITDLGLEGKRTFTLRGDGKNLIDFMYVDDAVDGFLALVRAPGRQVIDFPSGSPTTLDELVQAAAEALNVAVEIRHQGHTAEYISFYSTDRTMSDTFGVKPLIPLREGLGRLAAHLRGQGGAGRGAA